MTALAKVTPWLAQPLREATKSAKFQATLDQHADRIIFGHSAVRAGWIIGGVGVACFAASIFGWVTLLPLKTTEVRFFVSDKTSGYIGPATTVDQVPQHFSEANDHLYLERYIAAREGWVPETDRSNDYLVKLMSRRDEQERYAAWRKTPVRLEIARSKDTHIDVHNFRFHPLPSGAENTKRYQVQFEETTWRGNNAVTKAWSATVDFQWRPDLPMRSTDRDLNAGGFQVISYSAEADAV